MADTIIFDVDLAYNFKGLIANSDIDFVDTTLRTKITSANNNDFLMIKKKIGSDITILAVDKVDDALLSKLL